MEELQTHKQTKHTDKQANQATKQSDNNFYFREKKNTLPTHTNNIQNCVKETEIPTTSTKYTHRKTNKHTKL